MTTPPKRQRALRLERPLVEYPVSGCACSAPGGRRVSRAVGGDVGGREPAEGLIIDEFGLGRMLAADRAIGVAPNLQDSPVVLRQRVEVDHPSDQRFARANQKLDRFE